MDLRGFFQAEKSELQLGEPFSVTLVLKNETDHDVSVLVPAGRANGLEISVKAGTNIQVKDMTEEPEPGVVAEVKLSPGGNTSQEYPLSNWLIIKEAGSCAVVCAIEIEAREAEPKGEDRLASTLAISTELNFTFRSNGT